MARLAKDPYPIPEGEDEQVLKLLRERSNTLRAGEVVGALLKYQRADGYAYYLVEWAQERWSASPKDPAYQRPPPPPAPARATPASRPATPARAPKPAVEKPQMF